MSLFFLLLSFVVWCSETEAESESERRKLQQFPEISLETVGSGEFMEEFEDYALDQFPCRDTFRTLKAVTSFYAFGQKDNHGIYMADGHALSWNTKRGAFVVDRFRYVCETYMSDTDVKLYFSIIPDKNYFLAEQKGYLSMDYDAFYEQVKVKMDGMEYIDIVPLLTIDDYYQTDIHWRQENLIKVAKEIAAKMEVTLQGEYEVKTLEKPFYGVYYGQSALPLPADELKYLTNDTLEQCVGYDFQNGKSMAVYDMEKASGEDPYEMFLSGSLSLLEMETRRHLRIRN